MSEKLKIGIVVVDEYTQCGTSTWLEAFENSLQPYAETTVIRRNKQPDMNFKGNVVTTGRLADLLKVAEDQDYIFLQSTLDRWALKWKPGKPYVWWMDLMTKTTTPWSTFLHADMDHATRQAKTLPVIAAAPKFTGQIFAHCMPDETKIFDELGIELLRTPLPYPRREDWSQHGTAPTDKINILCLSRLMKVKNWSLAVRAAVLLDQKFADSSVQVNLTLAGAGTDSPGVASSNTVLKHLIDVNGAHLLSEYPPNEHKSTPWSVQLANGGTITYKGGYTHDQLPELMSGNDILVNATSRIGSTGPTEYVALEAMDAGLSVVQPEINAEEGDGTYTYSLPKALMTPSVLKGKHDDIANDLAVKIHAAWYYATKETSTMHATFETMLERHDPDTIARVVLFRAGLRKDWRP